MDREAWRAASHGVTKSRTRLRDSTELNCKKKKKKVNNQDFPSGSVVKNPPTNGGNMGTIPDPGRSHMLWSN